MFDVNVRMSYAVCRMSYVRIRCSRSFFANDFELMLEIESVFKTTIVPELGLMFAAHFNVGYTYNFPSESDSVRFLRFRFDSD